MLEYRGARRRHGNRVTILHVSSRKKLSGEGEIRSAGYRDAESFCKVILDSARS